MKLKILRSDAPLNKFPVYISNRGRSHQNASAAAQALMEEWNINVLYVPDDDGSKQGGFLLDARELSALEIEAVHYLIIRELDYYPKAYDVSKPY